MTDELIILGVIMLLVCVLIYSTRANDYCEPMMQGRTVITRPQPDIGSTAVSDALEKQITTLKMTSGSSNLLYLLEGFSAWLAKNPEEKYGLNTYPQTLPSVVVNTYFRNASVDNDLKFVKTNTNANLLTNALNKIVDGVINGKEGYQNYVPKRLQEFDAWLDDDFPRRKRFDIAMKGVNDMPTKIVIAQIINEFVSTNQIPLSEAKDLRKNVLSYLQLSTTIPSYQQNYNTTPLERLRLLLKNLSPDTPLLVKFKHFQDVYKNDPLGVELNNYFIWLADNDLLTDEQDVGKLQEHLRKTLEMYPKKTDLLKKAIVEQFISNLNIVKNK